MALVYERVPPLWTTMLGDLCVIYFYTMNDLFNRSTVGYPVLLPNCLYANSRETCLKRSLKHRQNKGLKAI